MYKYIYFLLEHWNITDAVHLSVLGKYIYWVIFWDNYKQQKKVLIKVKDEKKKDEISIQFANRHHFWLCQNTSGLTFESIAYLFFHISEINDIRSLLFVF